MTIDDIFTKSSTNNNEKKAKMLFGKLLIQLRKTNHIKLYALLESVGKTDIVEDKLELTLGDKVSFDMLNNKNDLNLLASILSEIESGIGISIQCNEKEKFDIFKFESFLKNEFGKILTIKKD